MVKGFKLQKVLDYRELLLEKEKAKLADLVQQEVRIMEQIERMTNIIREKTKELSEEKDFYLQDMYRKYVSILEFDRRKIISSLAEHRRLIHKQKEVTVEAYKDMTVVNKLKDKHLKEYREYMDKQEQLMVEDIVITRKASKINKEV